MQLKKPVKLNEESGVTLIELLAAITILSIIVTAFLSFFIQGARTNNRASDINEATFLAQEEMELMVHYSQTLTIEELRNQDNFEGTSSQVTKTRSAENGYHIETSVRTSSSAANIDNLYTIIVTVRKNDSTQALLENRLAFE